MVSSPDSSSSQRAKHRFRNTEKEKRRNTEINSAFYQLQCRIPELQTTQRLPKIKTLRLAIQYIEWLNSHLNGTPTPEFSQIVTKEIQLKNSYSARINDEQKALELRQGMDFYQTNAMPYDIASMAHFPPATVPTFWSHRFSSPDSQQSSSP